MDSLHWSAVLCKGNGGSHSKGPKPHRPGVVWSCSTGWISNWIIHYVSLSQHLSPVQVSRYLQQQMHMILTFPYVLTEEA